MARTFIAQYPGECAECGGELQDERVQYDSNDELVHVECTSEDEGLTTFPL